MNVIVQSKTLVVTAAIQSFVHRQVMRLIRHDKQIDRVTVFLENVAKKKNDLHSATARILIDLPGKNILVQEQAKNLYLAINEATRAAAQQVSKMKERRNHKSERLAFATVNVLAKRRR